MAGEVTNVMYLCVLTEIRVKERNTEHCKKLFVGTYLKDIYGNTSIFGTITIYGNASINVLPYCTLYDNGNT